MKKAEKKQNKWTRWSSWTWAPNRTFDSSFILLKNRERDRGNWRLMQLWFAYGTRHSAVWVLTLVRMSDRIEKVHFGTFYFKNIHTAKCKCKCRFEDCVHEQSFNASFVVNNLHPAISRAHTLYNYYLSRVFHSPVFSCNLFD